MKLLILLLSISSAFAVCDLCVKVDRQAAAWAKADSPATREKASKQTHLLFERLALAIHGGDKSLIPATVKLFGAMYSRDYDPYHLELQHFETDFKSAEFDAAFRTEVEKLPSDQKQKVLAALEARKNFPEKDEAPTE